MLNFINNWIFNKEVEAVKRLFSLHNTVPSKNTFGVEYYDLAKLTHLNIQQEELLLSILEENSGACNYNGLIFIDSRIIRRHVDSYCYKMCSSEEEFQHLYDRYKQFLIMHEAGHSHNGDHKRFSPLKRFWFEFLGYFIAKYKEGSVYDLISKEDAVNMETKADAYSISKLNIDRKMYRIFQSIMRNTCKDIAFREFLNNRFETCVRLAFKKSNGGNVDVNLKY